MRKAPKLFAAELNDLHSPIYINRLLPDDQVNAVAEMAMLEKLPLLLIEHAIPEDAKNPWLLLSYRLAKAYHPGFKTTRRLPKSGRPLKWTIVQQAVLVADIQDIAAERKRGLADACLQATKRFPERYKSFDPKGLQARYREALKAIKAHQQRLLELGLVDEK